MAWRTQLVYDANDYRHRHSLRGARATCAGRLTAWLERCTDSPGPRALVLGAEDEPRARSLVAALLDPSAPVPEEHAAFVRDARALLPPGPWERQLGQAAWEGAGRLRSDPTAIPATLTHAHLLHLVALLDEAGAELGVDAAYEFLLREPDGELLPNQDPASLHPKARLFSTALLRLRAAGAAAPLELEINLPFEEVGPELVRQWDAMAEELGKLSPERLVRREAKSNGKDVMLRGVSFDRSDFPPAAPAKKRKLALPPRPGPVRVDVPLDYVVGIRRARPVTDAERVAIARALGKLPAPGEAGAPRVWVRNDDVVGIVGVFLGTTAPRDLGPVVAVAGALRGVVPDVELVVPPGMDELAATLDAAVGELVYTVWEMSQVAPIEAGPSVPAALAAIVEAAATGRPFAGVDEAGIKRLFGLLARSDAWTTGAERVLAASDPVEVAAIGLPRLLKAGSGAGDAVSAAILGAPQLDEIATLFREIWDAPKTKYTWGDFKAELSEAAVDRLVAHPPLRAWLLRQLEVRVHDEMSYRRVSSTADLFKRTRGLDIVRTVTRAMRRFRHERGDTWGGLARSELRVLLEAQEPDAERVFATLLRETEREPLDAHDLEERVRTAVRLVEVAGDDALPWLDRMLSSRVALRLVVPALIELKSAGSTERLRAIARDPHEGMRNQALAELAARGVEPAGPPVTDPYEIYGRPPFSAELPPALDRWWRLTPEEDRALDARELDTLSETAGPSKRAGRVSVSVVSDIDGGDLWRLAEVVRAAAAELGWSLPVEHGERALTMAVRGPREVLETIVARVGVAVLRASLEVPDWTLQIEDDVGITVEPWGVQAGDVGTGTIFGLIPEESRKQRFLALARRRVGWPGVVAGGRLAGAGIMGG